MATGMAQTILNLCTLVLGLIGSIVALAVNAQLSSVIIGGVVLLSGLVSIVNGLREYHIQYGIWHAFLVLCDAFLAYCGSVAFVRMDDAKYNQEHEEVAAIVVSAAVLALACVYVQFATIVPETICVPLKVAKSFALSVMCIACVVLALVSNHSNDIPGDAYMFYGPIVGAVYAPLVFLTGLCMPRKHILNMDSIRDYPFGDKCLAINFMCISAMFLIFEGARDDSPGNAILWFATVLSWIACILSAFIAYATWNKKQVAPSNRSDANASPPHAKVAYAPVFVV